MILAQISAHMFRNVKIYFGYQLPQVLLSSDVTYKFRKSMFLALPGSQLYSNFTWKLIVLKSTVNSLYFLHRRILYRFLF